MHVTILRTDVSKSWSDYVPYLPQLTRERQEKIDRCRAERGRIQSLLTELLIRHEAAGGGEVAFTYNEYGKPHLLSPSGLHFSVSHTSHYIAYAAGIAPVGVDIEYRRSVNLNIAKHYFSRGEQEVLRESRDPVLDFYRIWTAKEAILKRNGTGFFAGVKLPDVCDQALRPYLAEHVGADFVLAVCGARHLRPLRIRMLDEAELLREFTEKFCDGVPAEQLTLS